MVSSSVDGAVRITFCATRAFQIGFSFPEDLAARAAKSTARSFPVEAGVVRAIAFNPTPKLECRFTVESFEKAFNLSLKDLKPDSQIGEIEQVLVSAYATGTVITRLVCRLQDTRLALDSRRVDGLSAELFKTSGQLVRGVFRLINLLHDAGLVILSKSMPFDGAGLAASGGAAAAVSESAFVREAEWRGWSCSNIIVSAGSISAASRAPYEALASSSLTEDLIRVLLIGHTFYWFTEADDLTPAAIADDMETVGYLLAKRAIVAGATDTLRAASDSFAAGAPGASGRALRRYMAQVRGSLARCHVFRISTTSAYRNLFKWLEDNLSSMQQGLLDYKEAEDTARLAIEGHDRSTVERISRGVNAVFMLFAAIAFVGVLADALGFIDYDNAMIPLPIRVSALIVATALALLAVVWSWLVWKKSDAE